MKKILTVVFAALIAIMVAVPAFAADGNVTYVDHAEKFIFAPGSEYSPTDLFDNFKGVMPGDKLTQTIHVKNDGDKEHYVKIYMRSLGAHKDMEDYDPEIGPALEAESEAFLKELDLMVENKSTKEVIFDSKADKSAQLTEWIQLCTLKYGSEMDLEVTLEVPIELDTLFQEKIGCLDWQFRVEEFPVDEPQTGDNTNLTVLIVIICAAAAALAAAIILLAKKKRKEQ